MIQNACGLLASCQWFLYVYSHLLDNIYRYMPRAFKCVYSISRDPYIKLCNILFFTQQKMVMHKMSTNLKSYIKVLNILHGCVDIKLLIPDL
jgi:hypothetical protein